jgi:predicted nucleic acid-binding protein
MNLSFIDTNILVYAYDGDAGDKHLKAQSLLKECWEKASGTLSTQVLQEFYVTVTQKLPLTVAATTARKVIETYRAWEVYQPTTDDIIEASELQQKYKLSFWDSLIVVAAQKSGAAQLFSEDLQHGQQIGSLKIVNPFR